MPHQFIEKEIEEKQLEKILDAANWAPTHKKTEPWRFKVFKNEPKENLGLFLANKYKQTSKNFSNYRYNKIVSKFSQSSVVIAICMQRDINESIPEWEEVASVAMAVQNMWLTCVSYEIGCYWSSPKYANELSEFLNLDENEIYINPTGNFVIGGPDGDSGLTGRKIIVDTYGGAAPHGGGAFSGKDPTKVDRSAAYASRYLAKNVVASKIADKCLIQLAYAIGVSKPLSIYVDLFDNDEEKNMHVEKLIKENFDLSPRGIREMLGLNKPIYEKTAAYGHFGRTPDDDGSFSWEKTDKSGVFSK